MRLYIIFSTNPKDADELVLQFLTLSETRANTIIKYNPGWTLTYLDLGQGN